MPSRRSFLAAVGTGLSPLVAGCSSVPRLQTPAGTDWSASVPEPAVFASPSSTDGLVAVGGYRGGDIYESRVQVFDQETGTQQWRYDFGRLTGLVAADGAVYLGEKQRSSQSRLFAFDARTGERRWTQTVDNLASALTVADGTLYAANGTLAALDTADGTVRWEHAQVAGTGFTIVGAPDDQLGADGGAVYYGGTGGVIALAAVDGSLGWQWGSPAWNTDVGPVSVGDTVYVGGDGDVVSLDRGDGSPRWQTSFGQDAQVVGLHERPSTLLVAERTDQAPSDTFGTLYVLSSKDGSERYELRFETPVAHTASTAETFLVGTQAGRVVWANGPSFFDPFETTVPGDGFVLGGTGTRAFAQTADGTLWALSPP